MTSPTTKQEWRRTVRSMSVDVSPEAGEAVCGHLRHLLAEVPGLVLFYRPMPGELDLEPLADALGWTRFCVTRTPEEGPLTIHPAIGAMERHRYGFQQPVEGALDIAPHHLSAVIVPGVAFDRSGTRLGHGAGYYDELLARVPSDRPRIGVIPEQLLFDHLPAEPHDISMTHVVTEHHIVDVI